MPLRKVNIYSMMVILVRSVFHGLREITLHLRTEYWGNLLVTILKSTVGKTNMESIKNENRCGEDLVTGKRFKNERRQNPKGYERESKRKTPKREKEISKDGYNRLGKIHTG
jgi:hypothetical protein